MNEGMKNETGQMKSHFNLSMKHIKHYEIKIKLNETSNHTDLQISCDHDDFE